VLSTLDTEFSFGLELLGRLNSNHLIILDGRNLKFIFDLLFELLELLLYFGVHVALFFNWPTRKCYIIAIRRH
jgi:hypothetical protein